VTRVLLAPDKFRGTATAREAAQAMAAGVRLAGWTAEECPLADGGEGFLAALGGSNRSDEVTGPLGVPVRAGWRLAGGVAVIESAAACGLTLLARPGPDTALRSTSAGVGELIALALHAGARRVLVGLGGTACTDGGTGALAALGGLVPFADGVEVLAAADVRTTFVDAAAVFGPQKGADAAAVTRLTGRLSRLAGELAERFGRDPTAIAGTGAAGGLGGGLWASGAGLVPGIELVAGQNGFAARLAAADLVLTGEGRFDATSLQGKVVGYVLQQARQAGVPAAVIAGSATPEVLAATPERVLDLTAEFGAAAAFGSTTECLRAAGQRLAGAAGQSSG
jgi:glycerate kinase